MTENENFDFDAALPSPLEAIRRLRADARDSVVALGSRTEAQTLSYVPTPLDAAITELANGDMPPHAIFVTGSAGGGKSGAAEYQRYTNPEIFADIVEDATHSDVPGRTQADGLANRLQLLSDKSDARPGRPILVAANIGMILQLAAAWTSNESGFDGLISELFAQLGLPGAPGSPAGVRTLRVSVLNLDDRPTSGDGGLLGGMLPMLTPAPNETLFNSARCESCKAIEYCSARANAVLVSTVAATSVDKLVERAAIDRGRYDTPRALWDFIARAVLPDSHYGDDADPCVASQRAYREKNGWWVTTGLLPLTLFEVSTDLGRRIANLDPARQPRREAFEAFADAGLISDNDAEPLNDLLRHVHDYGYDESPLEIAAKALALGVPEDADDVDWRSAAARTSLGVSVLLGEIGPPEISEERTFVDALDVYRRWQARAALGEDTFELHDELGEKLDGVVAMLITGLARLFGEAVDDRTFLPVQNYDPRQPSRAFVEYDRSTVNAQPAMDRAMKANPTGSAFIGYRALAVALELAPGVSVEIDLPAYRLLGALHSSPAGGGSDAERTFALRRTAEAIARTAAENNSVMMLVTEPVSGRRYQVTTQTGIGGRTNLRARAVHE